MDWRRLSLRIMIAALIFTAAAGAVAFLTGGIEYGMQLLGMGLLTSIATGMMVPLTKLTSEAKTRNSGLAGIGTVITAFVLGSSAIWVDALKPGYWNLTEAFWVSMATVAVGGIGVVVGLRIHESGGGRVASRLMLVVASIGIAGHLVLIWGHLLNPDLIGGRQWDEAHASVASFWALGALAVGCLIGFGAGDRRYWRWTGVAGAAAAFGLALEAIWFHLNDFEFPLVALCCVTSFIAYMNLMLLISLRDEQWWVRVLAIAFGGLTCLLIATLALLDDTGNGDLFDGLSRLLGASGIATACTVLCIVVLAVMNKRSLADAVEAAKYTISLECPRCFVRQTVKPGDTACTECGLKLSVKIEEPVCPRCTYPIYQTRSKVCPECGWTSVKSGVQSIPPRPAHPAS